ncbi:hypothetical protein DH2020_019066 [Rehmannia glutinosa]|uniref:Transmembrane protein n=1 Tax=Rehmannia glutinosa TaxID=99300 RepID=A0ABR0WP69_REHGL
MAVTPCTDLYRNSIFCKNRPISLMRLSAFPYQEPRTTPAQGYLKVSVLPLFTCSFSLDFDVNYSYRKDLFSKIFYTRSFSFPEEKNFLFLNIDEITLDNPQMQQLLRLNRKDVLLIGLGVTVAGIALESGLEYVGVDPLQAGNVVQLVLVLGLTVGWISTYIFRVSNKEMTYAQQLRDYEGKVMQKRLESLTEAEIEALLEQVEEEKRSLAGGEQPK